jgi:Family 4 glycosyl hydrolase C-terminal domain
LEIGDSRLGAASQSRISNFDAYGYLPAAGDRHVAEFFPYFLTEETHASEDYSVGLTLIEHRYEVTRMAQASVRAAIASSPCRRS